MWPSSHAQTLFLRFVCVPYILVVVLLLHVQWTGTAVGEYVACLGSFRLLTDLAHWRRPFRLSRHGPIRRHSRGRGGPGSPAGTAGSVEGGRAVGDSGACMSRCIYLGPMTFPPNALCWFVVVVFFALLSFYTASSRGLAHRWVLRMGTSISW